MPRSTRINLFPNHHHHGLNWVSKEGSDSGFGGQAWVSLKMTNNLPVGIYTVVFELFSGISGSSVSVTQLIMKHSYNKFMEMLIIKLLLLLMITKLHIVKLSFNSIQMDNLERLLFKSDITDPVTTILL